MNRYVYIDTSEFVASNFDVLGVRFSALKARCLSAQIVLLTTEILRSEIRAQIAKAMQEAERQIATFRSKAKILRNLNVASADAFFGDFDVSTSSDLLNARIDLFLQECKHEQVGFEYANSKTVFEDYFSGKSPFGTGKKKDEFPDAFVVNALATYAEENNTNVFIVSRDEDFQSSVSRYKNLRHATNLDEFLSIIAHERDFAIPAVEAALNGLRKSIEDDLAAKCRSLPFVYTDPDGKITSVEFVYGRIHYELLSVDLASEVATAQYVVFGSISFQYTLQFEDWVAAVAAAGTRKGLILDREPLIVTDGVSETYFGHLTLAIVPESEEILSQDIEWTLPKEIAVDPPLALARETKAWADEFDDDIPF